MRDEDPMTPDLWGNLTFAGPRRPGRPRFERTEENAHKVSMLLAMGWTNDRIAACILDPRTGRGISVPTLKRHFRSELQVRAVARDLLVARQLEVAARAAFGGNVGAMRFLQQLVEKNDLMGAEARVAAPRAAAPGKKRLDAQAAEEAEARLMAELAEEARGDRRH